MSSKTLTFLCLLALFLMIVSEVAARDLAETNAVEEESEYHRGGHGGGHGRGGGGGHGRGGGYGRGKGGGRYGGGRCRYGCCGHGHHGKCKCCSYFGQTVDPGYYVPETRLPHN